MTDLLAVEDLSAGYGAASVLHGLSLRLGEGKSMAVLGRNGMGKTTLLNSVVGVTRRFSGAIRLGGADLTRLSPERRAATGVGWVPQERNIFRSLTVEENLTAVARPGPWSVMKVYGMFPRLAERRRNMGDQLSGGEQQMLAIGRALMLNPRLLLLDEPTEGLAPVIVDELLAVLARIMRDEGMSALVVEQHAQRILGVTDEAIILERGRVVHAAPSTALRAEPAVLERYLGVSRKGGIGPSIPPAHPLTGSR
jgi:branched-chain amino acid transport system ATP-binding protein